MKVRGSLALLLSLTLAVPALAEDLADVGKPAPAFRLPVYNSGPAGATVIGLDRFTGPDATDKNAKVVLLSFMASFCAPCKKEMPWLQQLHEKFADSGLRVMMVSIDTEPEGQKIIDELIAQNKVTFPVLKDRFNLVARRWLGSKSPLPSVFLVDPNGVVQTVHRGYSEEVVAVLAADVEKALKLEQGAVAATLAPKQEVQSAAADQEAEVESAAVSKKSSKKKSGKASKKKKKSSKKSEQN